MEFNFAPVAVVPDATRIYRIPALGVALTVTSLTQGNAAYWSEALTRASQDAAMGGGGEQLTPEVVAARRRLDAPIIARHALRGWDGVKTSAGAAVAFSVENATAWLLALAHGAPHEFTHLMNFLRDEDHWTRGAIDAAKALAGNSPGV